MPFPLDPRIYPPHASANALVDEGGTTSFWRTRGAPTKVGDSYRLNEGDAIYTPVSRVFSPIPQDIEVDVSWSWGSNTEWHGTIGNTEPSSLNNFDSTNSLIDLWVTSDHRIRVRLKVGGRNFDTVLDTGVLAGNQIRRIVFQMRRMPWNDYSNQNNTAWFVEAFDFGDVSLGSWSGNWNSGDSNNPNNHINWKEWNTPSTNSPENIDNGHGVLYFECVDNGGGTSIDLQELEVNYINQTNTQASCWGPVIAGLDLELPDVTLSEQPNRDKGILDCTLAPFNCVNDGATDDYDALMMAMAFAIDYGCRLHLPADCDIAVSDKLEQMQWMYRRDNSSNTNSQDYVDEFHGLQMFGSSEGTAEALSKITLLDGSSGYGSTGSPKTVLALTAQDYTPSGLPSGQHTVNANYNQQMGWMHIDCGDNQGAVGFDAWGAQGMGVMNMLITGADFLAGVENLPGSGGYMSGVDVDGGRYGYKLDASQPASTISAFHLQNQSINPIILGLNGSGPRQSLNLVGGIIDVAAGLTAIKATGVFSPQRGQIDLLDCAIDWASVNANNVLYDGTRPIYMRNVYVRNCADIIRHSSSPTIACPNNSDWVHIKELTVGATNSNYSNGGFDTNLAAATPARDTIGTTNYDESCIIDEVNVGNTPTPVYGVEGVAPPPDLQSRHRIAHDTPNWENATIDVAADHGTTPDWFTDNSTAISAALAAAVPGDILFFSRGYWRHNDSIIPPEGVKMCGMGIHQTLICYPDRPNADEPFGSDEASGRPLVETPDSWEDCSISFMCLWAGYGGINASDYGAFNYAIKWASSGQTVAVQGRRNGYWGFSGYGNAGNNVHEVPFYQFTGKGYAIHYSWFQGNTFNINSPYSHFKVFDTFGRQTFMHANPEHCPNYPGGIVVENTFETLLLGVKGEVNWPLVHCVDAGPTMLLGNGGNYSGFIPDGVLPTSEIEDQRQSDYGYNPEPTGAPAWAAGISYLSNPSGNRANSEQWQRYRVTHGGEVYLCTTNHTSVAGVNEPGVGNGWKNEWHREGVRAGQIPALVVFEDTPVFICAQAQDEPRNDGWHNVFHSGTRRDFWHFLSIITAGIDQLVTAVLHRPTLVRSGRFPPRLYSLEATSVGNSTATPQITTDEETGTIYVVIVPEGDNPNRGEIESGQQSDSSPAPYADNISLTEPGLQIFSQATGLSQNTRYEMFSVQEDGLGADSLKLHGTFTTTGGSTLSAAGTITISGELTATRHQSVGPRHRRRTIGFYA